jgi:hypothetical protein
MAISIQAGLLEVGYVLLGATVDGPAPVGEGAGELIAIANYRIFLNKAENYVSHLSTFMVGLGDYAEGYTYFDSRSKDIVIGQDTAERILPTAIEVVNPSAVVDTYFNTKQTIYSFSSLNQEPTRELRKPLQDWLDIPGAALHWGEGLPYVYYDLEQTSIK